MSGVLNLLLGGGALAPSDPNFEYVSLLLPGNGTNGAQNNTFVDSSSNNFSITRVGNPTQGTFSPFSRSDGYWSNYFDGTGDYLSVPDNAAFDYGSGDFTLECWFMPSSSLTSVLLTAHTSGDNYGPVNLWFESGALQLYSSSNNSSFDVASGATIGTPTVGAWNHVAVSRSGTSIRCFLNGVLGSTTTSSATLMNATGTFQIGARNGTQNFTGFISNFRVVKGTAVYTAAFTPPTTPLTAITNTSLLTCQSNRFIDNSTNAFAITVNGNTSVLSFGPFNPTAAYSAATNGGSGYFDGTGDVIYATESSSQFTFGTGDYEYSAWIYTTSTGTGQQTIFGRDSVGNTSVPYIYIQPTTNTIGLYYSSIIISGTTTLKPFTWYYVVVSRVSGTSRIFLNGVQDGSASDTTNLTAAGKLVVGGQWDVSGNMFTGYIAGARVRKGSGVTSVTVPTSPPTSITNTELLLNFTNAGIYDAAAISDLETAGNAQISTAQSKFGGSSMYFDGAGDYLLTRTATNNLFAFSTGDFTIELWIRYVSTTGIQVLYDGRPSGTQGAYPTIYSSAGTIYYYTNTADRITGSSLSSGTWYHIAVSRSGTSTKLFVDGTQVGSTYTDSTNYLGADGRPTIGDGLNLGTYPFNGYINDLRVTKGIARYTANFTAPTAAFPLL